MKVIHSIIKSWTGILILFTIPFTLSSADSRKETITLEVLATAYNSVPEQTDDTPFKAAWGDILNPQVKSIAVSRDLLNMGLTKNSKVEIEGLPGKYIVLDKMNSRWEKKIDIYMGNDIQEALEWGVRKVKIKWYPEN